MTVDATIPSAVVLAGFLLQGVMVAVWCWFLLYATRCELCGMREAVRREVRLAERRTHRKLVGLRRALDEGPDEDMVVEKMKSILKKVVPELSDIFSATVSVVSDQADEKKDVAPTNASEEQIADELRQAYYERECQMWQDYVEYDRFKEAMDQERPLTPIEEDKQSTTSEEKVDDDSSDVNTEVVQQSPVTVKEISNVDNTTDNSPESKPAVSSSNTDDEYCLEE